MALSPFLEPEPPPRVPLSELLSDPANVAAGEFSRRVANLPVGSGLRTLARYTMTHRWHDSSLRDAIRVARVAVLSPDRIRTYRNPETGRRLARLIAQGDPGDSCSQYEALCDADYMGLLSRYTEALDRRGDGWDYLLCPDCDTPVRYDGCCSDCAEACRDEDEDEDELPGYGSTAEYLGPIPAAKSRPNPFMMGIEVELEYSGDDIADSAHSVTHHLRKHVGENGVGFEYDGSLTNGAEFVFGWGSLESWESCITAIRDDSECRFSSYGFKPERTCGFHVHVSPVLTVAPLSRLLYLVNHADHIEFIEGLVGRPFGEYSLKKGVEDWREKGRLDLIGMEVGEHQFGRYQSISLTSKPTLEFRLFAGTSKWSTVLRNLQVVDSMLRFAKVPASLEDTTPSRYASWALARAKTYPLLAAYLSEAGYAKESKSCA